MPAHGMCNGCGKGFGIFTREDTCHNCGLNFCSKCVTNKTAVPKLNGDVKHVCVRCFNILTGKLKDQSKQKRDISPPANFLKNLEAAREKAQHDGRRRESLKKRGLTSDPVVKSHLKPEYRNLSKEDMEIAERLEKLKQERREMELGPNPLPPVLDVEQRLARLKGMDQPQTEIPKGQSQASSLPQVKKMTQSEETTHLMKQVKDEVKIDREVSGNTQVEQTTPEVKGESSSKDEDLGEIQSLIAKAAAELEIDAEKALVDLKKDKEIMAKLQELKSRKSQEVADDQNASRSAEGGKDAALNSSDEEDEEDEVKTILQQVLEERILDEQVEAAGGFQPPLQKQKSLHPPEMDGIDPDELPWCCICNEDATIRCLDCDMDLYCLRCYKDGHKQLYEDDHQYIPYKKPVSTTNTTV